MAQGTSVPSATQRRFEMPSTKVRTIQIHAMCAIAPARVKRLRGGERMISAAALEKARNPRRKWIQTYRRNGLSSCRPTLNGPENLASLGILRYSKPPGALVCMSQNCRALLG
jgi:hypothetical protein